MAEATKQAFPKGKIILKEGRSGTSAFIIEKGTVEVSREINGHKKVLATLQEKDVFGEMGLIDGRPRTATVTALDDVEVSVITRELFRSLPPNNPGVLAIKRIMEQRLKKLG